MDDSILVTTKKLVGMTETYTPFDTDMIVHINTTMSILNQLGVGPKDGFRVKDENDKYTDLVPDDEVLLGFVKDFIYLKARLIFDPPASSVLVDSIKETIRELEFRIVTRVDEKNKEEANKNE